MTFNFIINVCMHIYIERKKIDMDIVDIGIKNGWWHFPASIWSSSWVPLLLYVCKEEIKGNGERLNRPFPVSFV